MIRYRQSLLIILFLILILILIIGTIYGIDGMIIGGVIGIFIAALLAIMIMIQTSHPNTIMTQNNQQNTIEDITIIKNNPILDIV
jgi:hypothetical protein